MATLVPQKTIPVNRASKEDNSRDWWPKMVMLKILKQYYSATGDKRVITLMTNYFKYQLKELPFQTPRSLDILGKVPWQEITLAAVYWLYRITGEQILLDLGDLLHKQTFDFTNAFLNTDMLSKMNSIHTVNLSQGMKEPLVYYQHHPEQKYLDAAKKAL